MSEQDIEAAAADGAVALKGEKKHETEQTDRNRYMLERAGSFEHSFALPDGVDPDNIGADFAKGVLTVTLPTKPEAKVEPKKGEVRV